MSFEKDIIVEYTKAIHPDEIQALRESVGWEPDIASTWQETLDVSRAVSSIRDDGQLVGIGFLIGTPRHGIIADVCVAPEAQHDGRGHKLVEALVKAAQLTKYVTLTFDKANPWLEAFYAQHGFEPIDNAMQLRKPTS